MADQVSNSHIDAFIDYVLDVKPYHTKLTEAMEEYVFHEDTINVKVSEDHRMMVVMGPDYLNNSGNINLKIWENAPVRPISTTSAQRIVQSDGNRRVYSIPAILHHKAEGQTGNKFTTTVANTGTEVPGLLSGVFNQKKFFTEQVKSVKKNNIALLEDVGYFPSHGAFSFTADSANRVTNGTFDTNVTGWNVAGSNTLTWVSGKAKATSLIADGAYFGQSLGAFNAGDKLTIVFDSISDGTSVSAAAFLGNALGTGNLFASQPQAFGTGRTITYTFTTNQASVWLWFYAGAGKPIGNYILIDNVYVTTGQTWKQANLSGISTIPSKSGSYSFPTSLTRKFGMLANISVPNPATAVYEEWTIEYLTSTTCSVTGSSSGNIGTATFGVPFTSTKINFTWQQAAGEEATPSMVAGDKFILTPSNKVCIHMGAATETWTLINVGNRYMVYGSVSGWQPDAFNGTWYDNGKIAFKVPKLKAWIYVNGQSPWEASLPDKSIEAVMIGDDAAPCVYVINFTPKTPSSSMAYGATVFNNIKGFETGLEASSGAWNNNWLVLQFDGNWVAGDEVKIYLAPEGLQTWFVGYDEAPYEFTLYDMGTAERAIPLELMQEYFPLYHSKDAIVIPSAVAGDTIEIEKVHNEFVRLRIGQGETLSGALAADNGWIPLEYRPNNSFPDFVTSIEAYLAADPTVRVFTITQPDVGNKPGLASIEFDQGFFGDFITGSTLLTFQFHQEDNYGQTVGVNFAEELNIQLTRLLGPELNPDTGFDVPAGWTLQTGATVSGGVYNLTAATGNNSAFRPVSLLPSTRYEVVFTVDSISSGNVSAYIGGAAGTLRTAPGTYTEHIITAGSLPNTNIAVRSGVTSTTAVISYFSVRKVGP